MQIDWRLGYADDITLDRIKTSHPIIRRELLEDYLYANTMLLGKGVRLRFSWVYRSPEIQNKLYNQRPRVTKAKAWQSVHQYGLAFDIVLLYDNDGNGTFEEASWDTVRDGDRDGIADWLEITKYFESKGYQNGFLRNGKKWDLPHFQKDFGLGWRDMNDKIKNNQYSVETIDGVEYKWIDILKENYV